jgi:hypothetical protein
LSLEFQGYRKVPGAYCLCSFEQARWLSVYCCSKFCHAVEEIDEYCAIEVS